MLSTIEHADSLSRRNARMMPFLAGLLLAQQTVFWKWNWEAVSVTQMAIWTVSVAVLLWALVNGGFFLFRDVRALANDQVTQANRAAAIRRGFIAAMLTGIIVFVISPYQPITAQRAAHLIISVGLASTLMSFGLLERKSLD